MAEGTNLEMEKPATSLTQAAIFKTLLIGVGIALATALMTGIWLWSSQPDYRVLFANYNDRDGGAIIAALQQMNIPYKFSDGGSAILVPAAQVNDARLRLASQGLPRGGSAGFELMENQKLGVSQFQEQINFQRALEGELSRSIQSIAAVQNARVHLALPKPSVFVRDQMKPSASVMLNLYPGRNLEIQQVNAIVHLIASSVPELLPSNVTVIDQNGSLLSENSRASGMNGLDPAQLKYVQQLQQSIVHQVESIITPIVGAGNVHAEAVADVDFSKTEQAAEMYKPNSPSDAAIRSHQNTESSNMAGNAPSGIPGALSNQPPAPATAPVPANAKEPEGVSPQTSSSNASNQKNSTVNYEVDKTVRYTQQGMGGIRRLSVAVVLNYRRIVDKGNKITIKPLTDLEKAQITALVKEAMGFSQQRGDSINVVNTPFDGVDKPVEPIMPEPFWKQFANLSFALSVLKYLAGLIAIFIVYRKIFKPLTRPVMRQIEQIGMTPEELAALRRAQLGEIEGDEKEDEDSADVLEESHRSEESVRLVNQYPKPTPYQLKLEAAKKLARDDPRIVANVVKAWMGVNE